MWKGIVISVTYHDISGLFLYIYSYSSTRIFIMHLRTCSYFYPCFLLPHFILRLTCIWLSCIRISIHFILLSTVITLFSRIYVMDLYIGIWHLYINRNNKHICTHIYSCPLEFLCCNSAANAHLHFRTSPTLVSSCCTHTLISYFNSNR